MGKKGKQISVSKTSTGPKCTCEHSYQCYCGNRPERPSRGHKWDPEEQKWGGKGHKQKGGSGQTSSVATAAKTTEKGQTTLAQWQKLPSSILADVCKKERRPFPKYKALSTNGEKHLYRIIIQDAKASKRGGDNDIILVPASSVKNEEQAKEEAALLALLHLTPSIPHERKLPEPYKATWLNALQAKKEAKSSSSHPKKDRQEDGQPKKEKSNQNASSATSATSSNLMRAHSYSSRSEKRKQQEEKKKTRLAKIRRHENMRMANRDVQVFMSAQVRKQIESLLRGDADAELLRKLMSEGDSFVKNENEGDDEDVVMSYVIQRLKHEGFTASQSRAGFAAVMKNPSTSLGALANLDEDKYMDKFYEESLQWLCVHLDEDQLPEGFDPRGRTLDVIAAPKPAILKETTRSDLKNDSKESTLYVVKPIVQHLGVSFEEALCLCEAEGDKLKEDFWNALCLLNSVDSKLFDGVRTLTIDQQISNKEMSSEEVEVLRAIFPEEEDLQVSSFVNSKSETVTELLIPLPPVANEHQTMNVQYLEGSYPTVYPKIFVTGGWDTQTPGIGTTMHSELLKFVLTLPNDEPMIFELFNYVQELLQTKDSNFCAAIKAGRESALIPHLEGRDIFLSKEPSKEDKGSKKNRRKLNGSVGFKHRPRSRNAFWGTLPKNYPPAEAFPKIPTAMKNARSRLPAATARGEFLQIMKEADSRDRVMLVTGETGCGKTTQIPQFILEEAPKDEKIIVTQPRRLAATGVADRVANERGEAQPGIGSVGYTVRGDSKISKGCRLLFCTTGILLRQLQSEGALDAITTIVIDEVHERHLDTDILLAILKETRPPHLRVVLMSATMDADRFAAYWGENTPRMHIPGFTHPVKDFTLEDVLQVTGYIPPKKGKKKSRGSRWKNSSGRKKTAWNDSEYSDDEYNDSEDPADPSNSNHMVSSKGSPNQRIPIEELVKRVNNSDIDYDMLAILVNHLVHTKERGDDGSILVFLPGSPEIAKAKEVIQKITGGKNMMILPLHGGLQPQDQKRVFDRAQYGYTKVILSTNVAETSITIDDCTIVVDTCKEKQSSYDPSNRMPLLIEKFTSRDSLKQRRGRAGRVRPGSCYKLISRETFSKLPQHGEPEIKRCALDQTLLSLLFLNVERGSGNFLSKLIDPPSQAGIDAAIFSLEKVGAVTSSNSGEERQVTLTPLGMHLAGIPAPPSVGKMMVMGALLGCRSAALAVAAGLSVGRSPFLRIDTRSNRDDEDSKDGYRNKLILEERDKIFETVGNSDHAMLAAVYLHWDKLDGGGGVKRKYLESLGLAPNGMRDMKQLVRQLDSALCNAGFHTTEDSDINEKSWRIIRSCIVSALAPTQIARVQRSAIKYSETAEGAIEKDGIAKELKFFTRGNENESNESKNVVKFYHGIPEERVFVHPSSANFSVGQYSCPWMVYYQLVRTSKPFMRDVTECSKYDLLLFGGSIEVLAADGLIVVDNYVRMSANARIGALIAGMRRKVDDLLSKKIADPSFDVVKSVEMKLIVKLLRTDGLGQ